MCRVWGSPIGGVAVGQIAMLQDEEAKFLKTPKFTIADSQHRKND
jgi:hypothetical protein